MLESSVVHVAFFTWTVWSRIVCVLRPVVYPHRVELGKGSADVFVFVFGDLRSQLALDCRDTVAAPPGGFERTAWNFTGAAWELTGAAG